jgi:uncharacterized membrane protein (DUF373 family)
MSSTSDISSFLVIFFLVESYKSFEAYVTSNKCFLGRVVEPITVKFFLFFYVRFKMYSSSVYYYQ